MTDILMDSRSPTQERGTSSNCGTIIHDTIMNALNEPVQVRIDYTLEGDIIVSHHSYHTYGNDSIPPTHLQEIVESLIEKEEGHSLIFQQ